MSGGSLQQTIGTVVLAWCVYGRARRGDTVVVCGRSSRSLRGRQIRVGCPLQQRAAVADGTPTSAADPPATDGAATAIRGEF